MTAREIIIMLIGTLGPRVVDRATNSRTLALIRDLMKSLAKESKTKESDTKKGEPKKIDSKESGTKEP